MFPASQVNERRRAYASSIARPKHIRFAEGLNGNLQCVGSVVVSGLWKKTELHKQCHML
ncbi:MAG: hypothetical protein MI923_14830 [Phycisphaerales bacterium]|nr:hypothetical protein [Phycisphaerales bacterium]